MTEGVALRERYKHGVPDFEEDSRTQTMVPSGQSDVVPVLKCPACGYSVEGL